MLMCGTTIMRCIVVGNSPNVSTKGVDVNKYDLVIRTGVPVLSGCEHLIGDKTDILVTRTKKLNRTDDTYTGQFDQMLIYNDIDHNQTGDSIYILTKTNLMLNEILEYTRATANLSTTEKPTLGLIGVCVGLQQCSCVTIYGIETIYDSVYISHGHLGDVGYERNNDRHCLYKEMLLYNKMIRAGSIIVL